MKDILADTRSDDRHPTVRRNSRVGCESSQAERQHFAAQQSIMGADPKPSRGGKRFPVDVAFALVLLLAFLLPAMGQNSAESQKVTPPPSSTPESIREFLDLLGIPKASWAAWKDDVPLQTDESGLLLDLVFRFSRFHPAEWELWQTIDVSAAEVMANPSAWRGKILGFSGEVATTAQVALDKTLLEQYELENVYQIDVKIDDVHRIRLFTTRIPEVWKTASAVGQPVFCRGIFVKRNRDSMEQDGSSQPSMWLVGPGVIWQPDRAVKDLAITADHLPLFQTGFDATLLDDARQTNNRGLGQQDRECFLMMLRATRSLANEPSSPTPTELIELLKLPKEWVGRSVRMRGNTRRVAKVYITDPKDRDRLGFDSYYQIDLFVDLAGSRIVIRPPQGKKADAIVLNNVYPITICSLSLPPELEAAMNGGPSADVRIPLVVTGRFMKLWSYHSPLVAKFGAKSRQSAPLVMATRMKASTVPVSRVLSGAWIAVAFALGLAALWLWLWRTSRRDRAFRGRFLIPKRDETEAQVG